MCASTAFTRLLRRSLSLRPVDDLLQKQPGSRCGPFRNRIARIASGIYQFLKRLKPFLRPEGYVVASITNIAHGSVRLSLMQGNFKYSPLDEKHLRFFTRESVERLFREAGFLITELRRTMLDVFDTGVEVDREAVPKEVLRLVYEDPEALTYQFVLAAHRSDAGETLMESVRLLSEQLAGRDRTIYELSRKLRNLEELRRMLDVRTEQLAEKEREVATLAEELAERNDRMARLVQFGREEA